MKAEDVADVSGNPGTGEPPNRLIDAATAAVREALREHKLKRNPVAAWKDGQTVLIAPEDIDV